MEHPKGGFFKLTSVRIYGIFEEKTMLTPEEQTQRELLKSIKEGKSSITDKKDMEFLRANDKYFNYSVGARSENGSPAYYTDVSLTQSGEDWLTTLRVMDELPEDDTP